MEVLKTEATLLAKMVFTLLMAVFALFACKLDDNSLRGHIDNSSGAAEGPNAPSLNVTYTPGTYTAGVAVSLSPSVEGDFDEIVVTPPLPSGLSLNSATGEISGIPTYGVNETFTLKFKYNNRSKELDIDVALDIEDSFSVNSTTDLPDVDPNDNLCLASNGNCTFRAAIDQAQAKPSVRAEILLPAGTYGVDSARLDMSSTINIIGADKNTTIIDGDLDTSIYTEFSYIDTTGNYNVSLSKLTIRDFSIMGLFVSGDGAFSIEDVNFESIGGAGSFGSALYLNDSNLSAIVRNVSFNNGQNLGITSPGLHCNAGTLLLEDSTFTNNTAGASSSTSAALYLNCGGFEVNRVSFDNNTNNSATIKGAAIHVRNSGSLTDIKIENSNTPKNGYDGVDIGIIGSSTIVVLDRVSIITSEVFDASKFSILIQTSPSVEISNLSLQSNVSAIFANSANLSLSSSSIKAASDGLRTSGTISVNNSAIEAGSACAFGAITSLDYNIATGASCDAIFNLGNDRSNTSPGFAMGGVPQDIGGFAKVIELDVASVARDTGDSGNCPTTDGANQSRPFGAGCDVGAHEYR